MTGTFRTEEWASTVPYAKPGPGNADAVIAYFLPGLVLSEPEVWLDGLHIVRLPFDRWMELEKNDFALTLTMEYESQDHFFCVFDYPKSVIGSLDVSPPDALLQHANWQVDCLVNALRLYKGGTLLDPDAAGAFIKVGLWRQRLAGPFRSSLIGKSYNNPYRLAETEYQDVARLVRMVRSYQTHWRDSAGDVALRNFAWSSRYGMGFSAQLYVMFVALEALFGSRSRGLGRGTLERRIVAACSLQGQDPEQAQELGHFIDTEGRALRNRVAHEGVTDTPELREPMGRIAEALRRSLRAFIGYACAWQGRKRNIESIIGRIQPWTAQVTFNHLLIALSRGTEKARALLATPRTWG